MSQGLCAAYTPGPEPVKLSELRAKTDQQLLRLVHSKLKLGLSVVALVENSNGSPDHAERLLGRAKQAVTEVKQLLAVLNEDQRRGFGATINSLQEALDHRGCSRELPRSRSASTT